MKKYNVSGMSCSACQTRVEKAVSKIDGVDKVEVSLLTNSMKVEGNVADAVIIKAVEDAGYSATSQSNKKISGNKDDIQNKEFITLRNRLVYSIILLIPLMYISMGHSMWHWPLPYQLSHNPLSLGLIQMILTMFTLIINQKFFVSGFKGLLHKAPNMDTLVALGAGAAFVYSTFVIFAMTDSVMKHNDGLLMEYMHDLYFESAAMIVTLITLGKMLESYSKGKTTNALKGLMDLAPKTATVITDLEGKTVERVISIDEINIGDIFVIKPGESIPVDGIVIEGESSIDESALTGESIPVDKSIDSKVYSASINLQGFLKCRATRVGEDTTISQIIRMVSDASTSKAPIAKVADKVSGIFVPIVMVIALVTIIVWNIAGYDAGFALARGISVLVISCPCALGLATPVAIMVGNGVGAKNGILFKNATALENLGKAKIVALDKTGTITVGKPYVTDILPNKNIKEDELLTYAYSIERKSEHPLAKAIVEYGNGKNIKPFDVESFEAQIGNGLTGYINDEKLLGGSFKYISTQIKIDNAIKEKVDKLSDAGKTPLLFAKNNYLLGIIAVADIIKTDSKDAIEQLKHIGIKVLMLTGDNEKTAKAIGSQIGVDEVIAGVLPAGKEKVVSNMAAKGKAVMVGDGINDAPALTRADIGIAIGAGADIAMDAADVVLVKNDLSDVVSSIRLSRAVLKNIHENLFWAFIYNIIGIPIAAGVWYPLLGLKLNPMFGAAAMGLSSFCVVTNALRLNLFNVSNSNKNNINLEELNMEKKMIINGMMCEHCEATVKKTLEAIDGIEEAIVSHEDNYAIVKLSKDVSDEVLKKAVEDKEYEVVEIN